MSRAWKIGEGTCGVFQIYKSPLIMTRATAPRMEMVVVFPVVAGPVNCIGPVVLAGGGTTGTVPLGNGGREDTTGTVVEGGVGGT